MRKLVTGYDLSADVMKALQAWGVPEHVTSLDLRIRLNEPVEIACTFYVTKPDGSLAVHEDALVQETKRFRLIEAEAE